MKEESRKLFEESKKELELLLNEIYENYPERIDWCHYMYILDFIEAMGKKVNEYSDKAQVRC